MEKMYVSRPMSSASRRTDDVTLTPIVRVHAMARGRVGRGPSSAAGAQAATAGGGAATVGGGAAAIGRPIGGSKGSRPTHARI
eukprot:2294252-Prymnesium_polylepis.1